ncbi:MAG: polysaccharide biosynthesis tyrosine autokinase [Actinomycetota bacterium]|nr:polysaccharide biosynthesis tyrosine autokinase [Actinomycetota bacterium]
MESSAESEILTFRYSDEDARRAQALSAAFAKAYLEFRQQDLRSDLLATYQAQKDRITALENRMEQLNREYEGTQDPQKRATLQAEANELHGQIGYLRNLLAQSTPPKDIRVGRIVDSPDYPTSPASPNYLLNGGLGLFVGLALGIGLAFLRERLDDRLRGREDLEAILGASVLTVVPRVRSWKRSDRPLLITTTDPQSLPAEAYRSLRTSLLFATSSHGLKTLLITSAQEDEGKTSTTANLGVVLAQGGKNVILVSADLRKPRLHRFFGVEDGSGLTDILTGEIAPAEALIAVQPNDLRLIRSGPVPGNPADLLGSEAMARVMSELRDSADLVLIDAAPLLAVADPVTLAPLVDGVLFVADAARATQSGVEQARERLDQVNARIAGAVLNNYDPARSSSRYYYGHYYSQRPRTTSEEVSLPASEVRSG